MTIWQGGETARVEQVRVVSAPVRSVAGILRHNRRPVINVRAANDETGQDYAADCARGRRIAQHLMIQMAKEDAPYLLGYAVRGMMSPGRPWTGAEVGFFHAIAERL